MIRAVLIAAIGIALFAQNDLQKAVEMHQRGDYAGAIEAYRRVLRAHPEAAPVRSNLGAALAHEGRYEEAVREYKLALEADPNNTPVRMNLGLAYFKSGDTLAAIEQLERVQKSMPGQLQPRLLLAASYLRIGENRKVIALLDPVTSLATADDASAYLMGTALIRDRQTERGQTWIDLILKKGDSAEARLVMGTAKFMANDLGAARADLERAVQLNPQLAEAHAYLGLTLLRAGDTTAAAKAFERELALDPNDFDANLQMGVLLRQDDKPAEARRYLERALLVRPGDFGVRYQLAAIDLSENRLEPARVSLESVVKEVPEFVEAHVSLATIYYRLKRKADGDREREIVRKLNADAQAKQTAGRTAEEKQ